MHEKCIGWEVSWVVEVWWPSKAKEASEEFRGRVSSQWLLQTTFTASTTFSSFHDDDTIN